MEGERQKKHRDLDAWVKVFWVVFIIWFLILVSSTGVLVSEKRISVGEDYYVEDYGNLGDSNQDSLVCKYFNGRGVVIKVYWYSANDVFGRSSCSFLYGS